MKSAASNKEAARAKMLADRKQRNRLSAAAHRQRKNEEISRLEELVRVLEDQNQKLHTALEEQRSMTVAHQIPAPRPVATHVPDLCSVFLQGSNSPTTAVCA